MYVPATFAEQDLARVRALLEAYPFAALICPSDGGALEIAHLPFLVDRLEPHEHDAAAGVLRGHVARANPLWREAAGQRVLAVFSGAQAYVSPSWYASKAATHKVVPTWNYAVVHAHGSLSAHEEAPWLHALVSRLTGRHEAARPQPWAVSDAPEDYVQQMLRAIVGIEIRIERLVGKWKVSQNRSEADREGVAQGLAAGASEASRNMAALVRGR